MCGHRGLRAWSTSQDMTGFKCTVDCTEVPLMSVVADDTSRQLDGGIPTGIWSGSEKTKMVGW